jgi:hypothetical protein
MKRLHLVDSQVELCTPPTIPYPTVRVLLGMGIPSSRVRPGPRGRKHVCRGSAVFRQAFLSHQGCDGNLGSNDRHSGHRRFWSQYSAFEILGRRPFPLGGRPSRGMCLHQLSRHNLVRQKLEQQLDCLSFPQGGAVRQGDRRQGDEARSTAGGSQPRH